MKKILQYCWLCFFLVSCSVSNARYEKFEQNEIAPTEEMEVSHIPTFGHVVWIVLENRGYEDVIGNAEMPFLNELATKNVLLTQYYGVTHPSLPNYLALIGGSTFQIDRDCTDCFLDAVSLPDLIEASGRTWKSYQEDLPSPCFVGNQGKYAQKHDPFIYFNAIRLDEKRCKRAVVALDVLSTDLAQDSLPDFLFISPNLCHSGHDCALSEVDQWLEQVVESLISSPALGKDYLIAIVYDETEDELPATLGKLDQSTGGWVPALLISPRARNKFADSTPYTHYSLLKTIIRAWNLPDLGATKDSTIYPIVEPWKE